MGLPLRPQQEELLERLLDALAGHGDDPPPILFLETQDGAVLRVGRRELRVSPSNVRELADAQLLRLVPSSPHIATVDVRPAAYTYAATRAQRAGAAPDQVEAEVRRFLEGQAFTRRHPEAAKAWSAAMAALWSATTPGDFDNLGGQSRVAMQQFVGSVIEAYGSPANMDPDVAKTRNRMRAVIGHHRAAIGDTAAELLDALLGYWSAAIESVQQLHKASQLEGRRPLSWEDARRAVFQTGLVMYEIDRTLQQRSAAGGAAGPGATG